MVPTINPRQQLETIAKLAGEQQRDADKAAALAASVRPTQQPPTVIIQQPKV